MSKKYQRKTRDVWRIYVNYNNGNGWEHESTELSRADMKENRKAYREALAGTGYQLKIEKGRERIED